MPPRWRRRRRDGRRDEPGRGWRHDPVGTSAPLMPRSAGTVTNPSSSPSMGRRGSQTPVSLVRPKGHFVVNGTRPGRAVIERCCTAHTVTESLPCSAHRSPTCGGSCSPSRSVRPSAAPVLAWTRRATSLARAPRACSSRRRSRPQRAMLAPAPHLHGMSLARAPTRERTQPRPALDRQVSQFRLDQGRFGRRRFGPGRHFAEPVFKPPFQPFHCAHEIGPIALPTKR